ncbi:hypothetical protein [Fictibacillus barbaricus]|uniref:DUF3941 domain-containing protein n=1 Tax=Fictibacillus barbaricus TaxID=182136 RepID=A0ABS2ZBF2_9BACL|nr:hypothetical protein [Fictibacillus barbaricus]MBN3545534.1 hypothetical protein [Fictibacillus barbaricus]GGB54169.1 hypothetical protein GCM10007199_19870 [Fictibacillus barbaricus]
MAKTRSKKWREKMIREGKRNPHADRSTYAAAEMYKIMATKKTKTKKDKMNQNKHKGRLSYARYSDGSNRSFFMVCATSTKIPF